jgi:hypothetical protein
MRTATEKYLYCLSISLRKAVFIKTIFFDVPIVMAHQVTLPQDPTYQVSDLDFLDTRMDKELLHFGKAEIKT